MLLVVCKGLQDVCNNVALCPEGSTHSGFADAAMHIAICNEYKQGTQCLLSFSCDHIMMLRTQTCSAFSHDIFA